ncbi:hypothetical protein ACJRO7_010139 [Eucalyptus globulus]|uniref:DUF3700 domain-containing protein n=1 Tax=Eucalyptus globulus TaxID=34317 RepID=A0ABD3LEJ7_EUCGL
MLPASMFALSAVTSGANPFSYLKYRLFRCFALWLTSSACFKDTRRMLLLKQQYGLNKTTVEVIVVIEAYRTPRDRRPYPADQVMRDITGKFAFVLLDGPPKTTFLATDIDGSVAFFWGSDSGGNLVLSDDAEVVKMGCGKSFAPFPKGCCFTSSGGLRSYEHPPSEAKPPVPWVDSSGHVSGTTFKVDAETKDSSMPGIGSAANQSSLY